MTESLLNALTEQLGSIETLKRENEALTKKLAVLDTKRLNYHVELFGMYKHAIINAPFDVHTMTFNYDHTGKLEKIELYKNVKKIFEYFDNRQIMHENQLLGQFQGTDLIGYNKDGTIGLVTKWYNDFKIGLCINHKTYNIRFIKASHQCIAEFGPGKEIDKNISELSGSVNYLGDVSIVETINLLKYNIYVWLTKDKFMLEYRYVSEDIIQEIGALLWMNYRAAFIDSELKITSGCIVYQDSTWTSGRLTDLHIIWYGRNNK